MSTRELAANLRLLNRWRRGEDDALLMPPPEVIGKWIDAAADALEVAADAAVAQEQNAHQYVELNRKLAELAGALRDARASFLGLQQDFGGPVAAQMGKAIERIGAALARAESAAPFPMREDPRYRGTDFRAAIDAARKEVQP